MLEKANANIKPLPIKGKNYAEVNQRIYAFRSICPNGAIKTEMLSNIDGVCVFKATIEDETGKILATGTAYEREGSNNINRTSYIENCETSAVGRALGMCGIGSEASVASAEEVMNAIINENIEAEVQKRLAKTQSTAPAPKEKPTITDEDFAKKLLECGSNRPAHVKLNNTYKLSDTQYKQLVEHGKKHCPQNDTSTVSESHIP